MINRRNWLDVKKYLRYIERDKQNDPATVKRARAHLRHLLEWADETPLPKARDIDPTLPTFLLTTRCDGRAGSLSPASIGKCLANVRQFFLWARLEWPLRYKAASESWIMLLRPPRKARAESRLQIHEYYTIDDVKKIAAASTNTLREERGKVAVCMLYLSGMRADALASIPISCVLLDRMELRQEPEKGVRTKNSKAAITYLLNIPELLDVVRHWDQRVRDLASDTLWYSPLTTDGMSLLPKTKAVEGRIGVIEDDVRLICRKAGVNYLSPHKLRHGHIIYAMKRAPGMEGMKAVSQNVMHASVTITDKIYAQLMNDDVKNVIGGLGMETPKNISAQQIDQLIVLLEQMKQSSRVLS